jgi:hypothetical protein
MAWFLFIQDDNGDLVSEGSAVPAHLLGCMEGAADPACVHVVREVAERPDWTVRLWDRLTRQLVDRPIPVLIDRLDDIQARFLADADFAAVWNALNASRRTQLRQGVGRVLASLMGARRFRGESEAVELD